MNKIEALLRAKTTLGPRARVFPCDECNAKGVKRIGKRVTKKCQNCIHGWMWYR